MEQTLENYFEKLAKINVNEHVEKKNHFNYISWAYAVDVLRKAEPTATWEVLRFDGNPYMKTDCGYFVEVAVTVRGMTFSQIHPVLDNYNKPIQQPNSFHINTSIQRCLVKAIALHGLGLYIYAGEDLPDDDGNGASQVPARTEQTRQTNTSGQAPSAPQANTGAANGISDAQVRYAHKLRTEKQISEEDFKRMIAEHSDGNTEIKQLNKKQASEFINFLNAYNAVLV